MEKCQDSVIAAKRVHFEWDSSTEGTIFSIRDEGEGFDVSKIKQKIEDDDPLSQHGRGILMAEAFSESIEYNNIGNEVSITIKHDESIVRKTPVVLSGSVNGDNAESTRTSVESVTSVYVLSSSESVILNSTLLVPLNVMPPAPTANS